MKGTKVLLRLLWTTIFLVSAGIFASPIISSAYAAEVVPVLRLSGEDRYKTAAAISREGWETSEYVVLAVGDGDDKFADALSGSPLSYSLNAPVLLTATNELSQSTRDEIIRLNARHAVVLGGTGVISQDIETALLDLGVSVERVWGPDRVGTAINVAEKIRTAKQFSKVFITTGEEFQYAMMTAPFASENGIPILFTEKDFLDLSLSDALKRWNTLEADIIGNTSVISQTVEDGLRNMGIKVSRINGADIYETNINIINTYKMDSASISIARDDIFADSLAGASFAAMKDMTVILAGPSSLNPVISDYLNKSAPGCVYIFGGPGGVSDYIISAVRNGNPTSIIEGNTTGNINDGGIAVKNGNWIYYHNASKGGKLYKVKADGILKSEICGDTVMNINVIGDWIYYTNLTDGSKIYKIKTDGSLRTRLNDDESYNITVMDNWIYYINRSDNWHLYRMSTDGSLRSLLNDSPTKCIDGSWDFIYYINREAGGAIYRVKPEKPLSLQRLNNVYAWNMDIKELSIYFSNEKDNRTLYKVNLDGSGLTKLTDDSAYDMQVCGDWIYYSNGKEENKLYKIKTDGTERTLIYNGSGYLLNIINDWIYFFQDTEGLQLYKIRIDGTGLAVVD